jgi:hypothetical protein
MKISRSKKALFTFALTVLGMLTVLAILCAFVLLGLVRFEWTDRFRKERQYERAKNKSRRILVIGDSFLAWWPVEHCLSKEIEKFCADRNIGLLNTAYGGFGPYEYKDQLETVGPEFMPGLVLLFYYVGNDLTDVQYRPNELPLRPEIQIGMQFDSYVDSIDAHRVATLNSFSPRQMPSGASHGWAQIVAELFEERAFAASTSATYDFDWQKMADHGIDPQLIEWAQNRIQHPNRIGEEFVNPWLLNLALTSPTYLKDNVLMETPENKAAWNKVHDLLLRIRDKSRTLRTELCIIAIPSTVQVDKSHFSFYKKATFEVDERLSTSTKPQQLLADFCRDSDVEYIDLLPAFKAYPEPSRLYWKSDDHLSDAGHQLAFETLRRRFLDQWAEKIAPE